jgi:PAS domain S-box-containing protein
VGTPLRVLLVEDSENDALLLLRELRRGGYEPTCERVDTPEGMERTLAEASVSREPWEIIISDYFMPRFRAPDALALLRRLGYDTPFIVVSGKVGEDTAVAMMRAGAHDYVTKENMARLCPAIERELREAEGRQERVRAEEELREGEERYRAVVEQAAEGILLVDVGTKRILEANAAYQNLLGYAPEEILRLTLYDVVSYPRESMDCYVERVREQRSYVSGERRHLRKDGSLVDVEVSANMISYGGKEAMCVVVRDITERKRAEEELRKSESSLSAAQRIAHLGNWDYDIARDEAYWSDELYRIFGFAPQAFVPTYKKFLDLVHPDDKGLLRREVRAALYGGHERGRSSVEYRVVRPDGEVRFVSTHYEVVHDASKRPVRLVGTIHDVTERKRAEEGLREIREAERRRIARDLHDGVLQDLSYIAVAMGVTQIKAEHTGLEGELQGEIDGIRRAVEGLREAVYNLRLVEEEDKPLPRLVESLVEQNRQRAPGCKIDLAVQDGVPWTPLGRAGIELLRIAQEALTNARRHSGARHVGVTLWMEGNDLVAEVSDDGRGFETETAPGIGLGNMRERAAALGGGLEVCSEPGKGTQVRFRAPMPGLLRSAHGNGPGTT